MLASTNMSSSLSARRRVVDDAAACALADGTRRLLVDLLGSGKSRSVGELAELLGVSSSAVSQHLKILREAELVIEERSGKQHIYGLAPEGLQPVAEWLVELCEAFWRSKATGLGKVLDELKRRES